MPPSEIKQGISTQSIQEQLSSVKTSKNWLPVIIIIVTILIGIIVSSYIFFKDKSSSFIKTITQASFPINPSNKAIRSYGYYYQFQGSLVNILEVPSGIKLVTDIQEKDMPEFIIDKSTIVVGFDKNNQPILFTAQSLKTGEKVKISTYYDMNKKKWRTSRIIVDLPPDFTNSVSESTTSADQK